MSRALTSRLTPAMDAARDRTADAAVALVEPGMIVGLGTGDTARRFVERLGRRVRDERLEVTCVVTSESTAARAREANLTVRPLVEVSHVDLAADGADEVDPRLDLIKGAGGAHTREKIVAASARTFVVLVDETKLVDVLGAAYPVPLEVVPEAVPLVCERLRALGGVPVVRPAATGPGSWITDLGHHIVDARFGRIENAPALDTALNAIPGVIEHGLFVGMASLVLAGELETGQVRRLARPRPAAGSGGAVR
jgi:ribose 5-phosphate isomerase A